MSFLQNNNAAFSQLLLLPLPLLLEVLYVLWSPGALIFKAHESRPRRTILCQ